MPGPPDPAAEGAAADRPTALAPVSPAGLQDFLPGPTTPARRLFSALLPLLVFAAGQLVTLVMVAWVGAQRGRSVKELLESWDVDHFVRIAADGYVWTTAGDEVRSPAFFPGLPALMRLLSGITGWAPVSSGHWVSALSSIALVYGLMRLARLLRGGGPVTGLALVALVSISPISIVLMMVYTEALFCALAVWCLVCAIERRWLLAGTLALVAGLVRPTAGALCAALFLAALIELSNGFDRRSWRPIVGVLLSPLGLIGYILYVGHKIGSWNAWFVIQTNGWHTRFDYGHATWLFIRNALVNAPAVLDLAVTVTVGAALVLFVVLAVRQRSVLLTTYTAIAIAMNIGSDGIMNSKVRLMVPAIPLLAVPAIWLSRQRPLVLASALGGYLLVGTWYSAYGLVIYGYAI